MILPEPAQSSRRRARLLLALPDVQDDRLELAPRLSPRPHVIQKREKLRLHLGVSAKLWEVSDLVALLEAAESKKRLDNRIETP